MGNIGDLVKRTLARRRNVYSNEYDVIETRMDRHSHLFYNASCVFGSCIVMEGWSPTDISVDTTLGNVKTLKEFVNKKWTQSIRKMLKLGLNYACRLNRR